MEPHKTAWLKTQNLDRCEDIADCDPTAQTVTMRDGTVHQVCDVYTRVMGYHRPVAYFNAGKQSEHRDRKHFTEAKAGSDA